jgi:hypothetical protein
MTLFRTRYGALALCAAAVAVAGCGSSSQSKSTPASPAASTPSTPSTPSTGTTTTPSGGFAAQLNALCQQTNAKASKVTSADAASVAAFVEGELPKYRALTPPASEKAAYAKFLADAEAELRALKAHDASAAEKAAASGKKASKALGAPACAA